MSKTSKTWLTVAIIAAVIIIDQVLKIWVKTSFYWGEDYEITSWFHLRFIQNLIPEYMLLIQRQISL